MPLCLIMIMTLCIENQAERHAVFLPTAAWLLLKHCMTSGMEHFKMGLVMQAQGCSRLQARLHWRTHFPPPVSCTRLNPPRRAQALHHEQSQQNCLHVCPMRFPSLACSSPGLMQGPPTWWVDLQVIGFLQLAVTCNEQCQCWVGTCVNS